MKIPNCCDLYEGGKVPPCSAFLDNIEPIIKNGKIIFRNENRLYFFISLIAKEKYKFAFTETNIQISLCSYIIGLFLFELHNQRVKYDKNMEIHSNKCINDFIHKTIQEPPKIKFNYTPILSLVYSNQNAILNPFTYTVTITPVNLYILLVLNRIEGNPGLFFINNSYVEENEINFTLASLHIVLPEENDFCQFNSENTNNNDTNTNNDNQKEKKK